MFYACQTVNVSPSIDGASDVDILRSTNTHWAPAAKVKR